MVPKQTELTLWQGSLDKLLDNDLCTMTTRRTAWQWRLEELLDNDD